MQKTSSKNTLAADLDKTFARIDKHLDAIEKSVALIPKLYESVNIFMAEILESRQERVLINSRLDKLEKKTAYL